MAQMIVAVFADRGAAEGALQALLTSGIARDRIGLVGAEHNPGTELAPMRAGSQGRAGSRLADLPVLPEEIRSYEAALGGGRVLLTVRVEDSNLDRARETIGLFDPLDLEGGSERGTAGASAGVDVGAPLGAGLSAGGQGGATNTAALPGMTAMAESLDEAGTADLRSGETSAGDTGASTLPTGDRRAEERAGAPGTMELAASPVLFRRDPGRSSGGVRVYVQEE